MSEDKTVNVEGVDIEHHDVVEIDISKITTVEELIKVACALGVTCKVPENKLEGIEHLVA